MPVVLPTTGGAAIKSGPLNNEKVYVNRNVGTVPTLEEVLLKRQLRAEQQARTPAWLKDQSRLPTATHAIDLPYESTAIEVSRSASRLSSQRRKRGRSSKQHSISAPLPYLRPLSGASPPVTRGSCCSPDDHQPPSLALSAYPHPNNNNNNNNNHECQEHPPRHYFGYTPPREPSGAARASRKEEQDRETIVKLTDTCQDLVERLHVVERELAVSRGQQHRESNFQQEEEPMPYHPAMYDSQDHNYYNNDHNRPLSPTPPTPVISGVSRKAARELLYANVDVTLKDLSNQVDNLSDVFSDVRALEIRRRWAIGKLIIFAKTLLQRRRQVRFKAALNVWRRLHCREVILCLQYEVARQERLRDRVRFMANVRNTRILGQVVSEWRRLTKLHRPERQRVLTYVEGMIKERLRRHLLECVQRWWKISVGPESGRGLRRRHKEREDMSRERLHKLVIEQHQNYGILTKDMVEKEVRKLVMEEVNRRYHRSVLSHYFGRMLRLVDMSHILNKRARYAYRVKMEKIIFYPWREWAFLNAKGIARKKWLGPGRYQIRYNQAQIDTMGRKRLLRYYMRAWSKVIGIYKEAHRRYRAKVSGLVQAHFQVWRAVASKNMRLRRMTIAAWKEYGVINIELPFKTWYLFKEKRRKDKEARDRIVTCFVRHRKRRFILKILRYWRHQALYGRTGALYSRFELIRSLGLSKDHSRNMLEEMEKQEAVMHGLVDLMEQQRVTIQKYEENAKHHEEETLSLKMSVNHAEDEVVRMQSLIDCVTNIYPTAVQHVLRLQPGFNFRDRGLSPLAQLRLDGGHRPTESVTTSRSRKGKTGGEVSTARTDTARSDTVKTRGEASTRGAVEEEPSRLTMHASTLSSTVEESQKARSQQNTATSTASSSSTGPTSTSSTSSGSVPKRITWVLGLTNFRQIDTGTTTSTPTNDSIADELMDITRLHSLFEFMRSGDESVLQEKDRAAWQAFVASPPPSAAPASSPHASKSRSPPHSPHHTSPPHSPPRNALDANNSSVIAAEPSNITMDTIRSGGSVSASSASGSGASSSEAADEATSLMGSEEASTARSSVLASQTSQQVHYLSWPQLTSEAPSATNRTWGDFLEFLAARLPQKRKTKTLQEGMLAQIHKSKARSETMLLDTFAGNKPSDEVDIWRENVVYDVSVPTVKPFAMQPSEQVLIDTEYEKFEEDKYYYLFRHDSEGGPPADNSTEVPLSGDSVSVASEGSGSVSGTSDVEDPS